MENLEHILVVVDRGEQAGNVLDKAAALAAANDSRVHVIRVIFESLVEYGKMSPEDAQALKLFIMQAEEQYLDELVEDFKGRFHDISSATIWNQRVSSAVLHVATDLDIDLVVKGTDRGASHFPRHPDDWNLIREARCPVLLTSGDPWASSLRIAAAVDALDEAHVDLNVRILEAAGALTQQLGGVLDIVSAYPSLEPWSSDPVTGLDFVKLKNDLENEVCGRIEELTKGLGIEVESVRLGEGPASRVVKRLTDDANADIIVVGTAARQGVSAWVIGNTSENLLGHVDRDLLVLHA